MNIKKLVFFSSFRKICSFFSCILRKLNKFFYIKIRRKKLNFKIIQIVKKFVSDIFG
jgi:hypothetical protein